MTTETRAAPPERRVDFIDHQADADLRLQPSRDGEHFPFVVLEGIDGVGKTTVGKALAATLKKRGMPTIFLATPPSPFDALAANVIEQCSIASRFFFFLSSLVHASNSIRQSLSSAAVICDRYIYSTIAYHRAFGLQRIPNLDTLDIRIPDFCFLLSVGNEGVRRNRILARQGSSPADLISIEDAAWRVDVVDQFERFDLISIETDNLTPSEVASTIVDAIMEDNTWPMLGAQ